MDRVASNGSFYVSDGGFKYSGTRSGDPNQIVTFDIDAGQVNSTDLDELFDNDFCVSQYTFEAPATRPIRKGQKKGADLEVGDFWTDRATGVLSIWDSDSWVYIKPINGNPVGTIINTVITNTPVVPPTGYLACDGTPCPPQYTELSDLLLANSGSILLPAGVPGQFIKF